MLRIHSLDVNPGKKAAKSARKKGTAMATALQKEHNRFVKSFASKHRGEFKGKTAGRQMMKAAARAWNSTAHAPAKRAKKAASRARKATRSVAKRSSKHTKRRVGYDPRQVRLVKVKKGAHYGGKRAKSIGRGLFRLSRNPGQLYDRIKAAISVKTAGTIIGAGGGLVAAVFLPTLLGDKNDGGMGVLFSALATVAAAAGAALAFPAAVVPLVIGGGLVTGVRGLIVFVPKALGYFLKPLLEWSGAAPAGGGTATKSGFRREKGSAGYIREKGTAGDADTLPTIPGNEAFSRAGTQNTIRSSY